MSTGDSVYFAPITMYLVYCNVVYENLQYKYVRITNN